MAFMFLWNSVAAEQQLASNMRFDYVIQHDSVLHCPKVMQHICN